MANQGTAMATRSRILRREGKPHLPRSQSESNPDIARELLKKLQNDLVQTQHQLAFFQTMAMFSVQLPPFTKAPKAFQENLYSILVDSHMQHTLERAKVISWCRTTKMLYPVWTKGDGNCLLHAVSLYMWGLHDYGLFLRRLVHKTLENDSDGREFRSRWQKEKGYLNSVIPNGGLLFNSTEWDEEWNMVLAQADDLRQDIDPNTLPYKSLEEIHIFVLANILHRTIVILSEDVIRTIDGNSISPNNVGGIYLPTLCYPCDCVKSPITLCYSDNHFTPLISMEDLVVDSPLVERAVHAVPLVTVLLEQLPVHFLSRNEEANIPDLLNQYLELMELPFSQPDKVQVVLSAKLTFSKLPRQYSLMDDFYSKLELDFAQNAVREEEGMETSPPASHREEVGGETVPSSITLPQQSETLEGLSLPEITKPGEKHVKRLNTVVITGRESKKRRPDIPLVAEVQRLAIQEAGPCVMPGCPFHGLPENGGRCSGCITDFSRENRQMPSATSTIPSPPYNHPSLLRSYSAESRPLSGQSSYLNSISDTPCQVTGCLFLASWHTYPFCHIHKRTGIVVSTLQQGKGKQASEAESTNLNMRESSGIKRFNSRSLESVQYVTNLQHDPRATAKKLPYDKLRGQVVRPTTKVISEGLQGHEVNTQASRLCKNVRCPNKSDPGLGGYCPSCYHHTEERKNVRKQTNVSKSQRSTKLPEDRSGGLHNDPSSGKPGVWAGRDSPYRSSSAPKAQEGSSPQMMGSQYNLPKEGKTGKDTARLPGISGQKLLCSFPGCQGVRLENQFGMCLNCFKKASDRAKDGNQTKPGSYASESPRRQNHTEPLLRNSQTMYTARDLHSLPAEAEASELTSYQQQLNEHPKCVSPVCDQHGYESYNGLCPECYNHLVRRVVNTGESVSPTEVVSTSRKGILHQSQVKETGLGGAKKCVTPGCDMFSSSQTGQHCSRCFLRWTRESESQQYDIPPTAVFKQPIEGRSSPLEGAVSVAASPCRNPQCDKYGDYALYGFCSKCCVEYGYPCDPPPPGIPVKYSEGHRPVTDPRRSPVSKSTAAQSEAGSKSPRSSAQAHISQDKLLAGSAMALAKCKNPLCNNYGNSHCRGYCNTCHVAIRSSLYDH